MVSPRIGSHTESGELGDDIDIGPSLYQSEDQLVVALDFGTTFSGIAYAFANEREPEVISIMDWPGNALRGSGKHETD
jgi:hypothetical protein